MNNKAAPLSTVAVDPLVSLRPCPHCGRDDLEGPHITLVREEERECDGSVISFQSECIGGREHEIR